MIYLIDDNKNNKRVEEMQIYFVDNGEFRSILTPIEKLNKGCDLNFLNNANCVLIHKTTDDCDSSGNFIEKSNTNAVRIIEDICDYGENIPIVIFSNRMDEKATYSFSENPNCIYQIKKSVFYIRLYDFLVEFNTTGKIELRILANGVNFKSEKSDRYGKKIIESLLAYNGSEIFKISMIDLQNLNGLYSYLNLGFEFERFAEELDKSGITVNKFVSKITQALESIEQYGEYIYNWQN